MAIRYDACFGAIVPNSQDVMEERPQKCTVHDMARQLRYIPETSIIRHVTKRNGRRTNIMAVHFDVPFLAALDFGRDPVRNNGSILYLLRVLS